MNDRLLRLDLEFGPRSIAAALAAVVMFSTATELSSESLTMSTYYPAPEAVYGSMMTTNTTQLATTSGGLFVGGSPATTATAKLQVQNGGMGIGTTNPLYELDVEGEQTFGALSTTPKGLSWHYTTAWSNGALYYGIGTDPGQALAIDFYTGVKVKAQGGYGGVTIWDDWCDSGVTNCAASGSGYGSTIAQWRANYYGGSNIRGKFGAGGQTAPAAALDIGGDGVGVFRQPAANCYQINYTIGIQSCRAGTEYITNQSGVMARYSAGFTGGAGSALCCQCPLLSPGGAPSCPSIP